MRRKFSAVPLMLIALLSMLFLFGGCSGYSSVSVGVGGHDYWSPYYRYRPSMNYQYRYHPNRYNHHPRHPSHGSIGRPHHRPSGTHHRPRPRRH